RFLSFGVESANEYVLAMIKKGERLEQIEEAVRAACEIGYDVTLFFIIGLPGETPQDAENSLRFAQKYPVFDAKFYNLIPFPNTPIYEWLEQHQAFLAAPQQYLNNASHWDTTPLFETPEFPREERIRMLKKAHVVRKQIRKAAMRRKLVRFGPLRFPAAAVFVQDGVQDLLLHNRYVRRIAETTFRYLTNRSGTRHG
ncbi:radical SAM protein, partial [candidate division KSB3 bacterium]|nr:radical SAM protein [candidate division KSB3 bacterium]MBD3322960.1 radical SAM protein [candidate division KSB3 bacterium]